MVSVGLALAKKLEGVCVPDATAPTMLRMLIHLYLFLTLIHTTYRECERWQTLPAVGQKVYTTEYIFCWHTCTGAITN